MFPILAWLQLPETLHSRRDYVRYNVRHSILQEGTIGGVFVPPGQRLSIMMRVCLPVLVLYNPPVLTCGVQDMPGLGIPSML